MSFSQYAALARRLDQVRRDEARLTTDQRQEVEQGRADLERLVDRLAEQQTILTEAAAELRFRMPLVDPAPSGAVTARDALTAAGKAADTADASLDEAVERAHRPQFLPGASPLLRNAAVYGSCAGGALLLGLLLQLVVGESDPVTVMLWSLLGFPMVAFFVGYLLVGMVGTPRIPPKPPERDERGLLLPPNKRVVPQPRRHPRMGLAICFLAAPVFWLLLTAL